MNNIFLDTNIIIDFLDEQRENHKLAVKLLMKLTENNYNIFISEDMLSTIYYMIKNKQKVLHFFKDILNDWNIVPFEKDIIKESIEFALTNKKDFEDVLQCLTAKKYNCFIATNDTEFVNCGVKILNYQEFFNQI